MTKFKSVPIGGLFNFPATNSNVTKEYCNLHPGFIPVYGSSKDENSVIGNIREGIPEIKYYENCLSWNRNGSVGYVFVRNHKFSTNEDHRAMTLKENLKGKLDLLYLKYEIEKELLRGGFSYINKCGLEKIKKVSIRIPLDVNDNYDLAAQNELAIKYHKMSKIKRELGSLLKGLEKLRFSIKNGKVAEIGILDLFDPSKGQSKYTKLYFMQHKGIYPVYSSQTENDGIIGYIDTFDYDGEFLTWTTDGIYAGTVFYRNGKFSMTTHCGVLRLKTKYAGQVSLRYIAQQATAELQRNAVGEGNKRVTIAILKKCNILLPFSNGKYDISQQEELANKYEKLRNIQNGLTSWVRLITDVGIEA